MTHAAIVSPINRFYGSTMFAPRGPGLSTPGYIPAEEKDALCESASEGDFVGPGGACPDTCAFMPCNLGMSFTVQCPSHCYDAGGPVYGSPSSHGLLGPYEDTSSICRCACQESPVKSPVTLKRDLLT